MSSCSCKAYPENKFNIDKDVRNLIDYYKIGDTIIYKSSTNIIDSFLITKVDSSIYNSKGYFISAINRKEVTVYYKQIPVDSWRRHWIEMGPNNSSKKEKSEDASFIIVEKFPDSETVEVYINFKELGCSINDIPALKKDTINIGDQKFTNYYEINNCATYGNIAMKIPIFYFTIDRGLVAFKDNDGITWTRQN